MLKFLDKAIRLALYAVILAALLLACRFLALWLGLPAWTSPILWLLAIACYYLLKMLLGRYRSYRDDKRAAKILAPDQQEDNAAANDPELASRMRLTWKSGLGFLGKSRLGKFDFAYKLPWYIALGDAPEKRRRLFDRISVKGAAPEKLLDDPEFAWRFASRAVWLDLDFSLADPPDERWRLFVAELMHNRGKAPLGGVVAVLDSKRLLASDEETLKTEAANLRTRLDHLITITGAKIPVYLLVDHIDAIYGMRSLAAFLDHETLEQPFGAFRMNRDEAPAAFAARAVREASAAISGVILKAGAGAGFNRRAPDGVNIPAAAFQGADELPRLAGPLSQFCREAFNDNPYQMLPTLRGVFLGTSEPSRDSLPSDMTRIPSFHPETEEGLPNSNKDWFFKNLVAEWIPRDPAPVGLVRQRRHIRAVSVHSGLAILLVGTLLLCWGITLAYREGRNALASIDSIPLHLLTDGKSTSFIGDDSGERRSAATKNLHPDDDDSFGLFENISAAAEHADLDNLNILLEEAMRLDLRNRQWRLPRFGMTESLDLEARLRQEYCDIYYNEVMLPSIERIRSLSLAAIDSSDPNEIGNTLLVLTIIRKGINERQRGGNPRTEFDYVAAMVDSENAAEDMRARTRLEMYLSWTRDDKWMEEASSLFLSLERQIMNQAMGGKVMAWLPDWIDGLNSVGDVDTSSVWNPVSIPSAESEKRMVRGAWTRDGYLAASRFLDNILPGTSEGTLWTERRDAILAEYRRDALFGWRDASYELWRDFQKHIPDNLVAAMIRQASLGNDPATRLANLLADHILPMFEDVKSPPEVEWLVLNRHIASALGAAAGGSENSSVLSRMVDGVAKAVQKIGSDENMALLSRNIGFSSGSASLTALDDAARLSKAFADIAFLCGGRDSCLDIVRQQYAKTGTVSAALSSEADKAATPDQENISRNPFADALDAADDLNGYLTAASGSSAWVGMSPKAKYNYMRYLAVRLAAVHLDALWVNGVFNPASLFSGSEAEKDAALFGGQGAVATFLNSTAAGFWRVSDGLLKNADWDGLRFMFNDDFLNFCTIGIGNMAVKRPEKIEIPFRVNSVTVDPGARERPHQVDFFLVEGGAVQNLPYRNYVDSAVFEWKLDKNATAGVRIHFPSATLTKNYDSYKGFGEFVREFQNGGVDFHAADFPGESELLNRLGVTGIRIRTSMQNQQNALLFMDMTVPPMPSSIIAAGGQ